MNRRWKNLFWVILIGVALTLVISPAAAQDSDWASYWYNTNLFERDFPYQNGLGVQVAVLDTGITSSYECRTPANSATSDPAAITSVEVFDAAEDEVFRVYKAVVYTDPPLADVINANFHTAIILNAATASGNSEYRYFGVTGNMLRKGVSNANNAVIPGSEQSADITPDGRGVIFSLPTNIDRVSALSVAAAAADANPICNATPTLSVPLRWGDAIDDTPLATFTDTSGNVVVCGEGTAADAPEAKIMNVSLYDAPSNAPFPEGFVVRVETEAPPDDALQNAFNYTAYLNVQRGTGRIENWMLIYQQGRFVSQVLRGDNSPVPVFSYWGAYLDGAFTFNIPGDATLVEARTAITPEAGATQLCNNVAPAQDAGWEATPSVLTIVSPDEAANRPQDDFISVPDDRTAEERVRPYALLCPPFDSLAPGDPLWEEIEKAMEAERRAFPSFDPSSEVPEYEMDILTGEMRIKTAAGTRTTAEPPQRVQLRDPNAPFDPINNPIIVDRRWPCPEASDAPPQDAPSTLNDIYGRPIAGITNPPGSSVLCQDPATGAGDNPADILTIRIYSVPPEIDPNGSYLVEIQTQAPFSQLMEDWSAAMLVQAATANGAGASLLLETHDGQEKIGAVDGNNQLYRGTSGLWGYSNLGTPVVRLPGTAMQFTIRTFHSDGAGQPVKCDTTAVINLLNLYTPTETAGSGLIICPPLTQDADVVRAIQRIHDHRSAITQFPLGTALESGDVSAPYNALFNPLRSRAQPIQDTAAFATCP